MAEGSWAASYDVLGFRARVEGAFREPIAILDRLNACFRAAQTVTPHVRYAVARGPAGGWHVAWRVADAEGSAWEALADGVDASEAARAVERHLCSQAIRARSDLLYLHAAALAARGGSLLLPGSHGAGKTTLALALWARGSRLLADDVVLVDPVTLRAQPFPRSLYLRQDGWEALQRLGLRFAPDAYVAQFLCASALGMWSGEPVPPIRWVVLLKRADDEPPTLTPVTQAEAAVALMRGSSNLRTFPRSGLTLLGRLLAEADCYELRTGDDPAATAAVVLKLAAGEARRGSRAGGRHEVRERREAL